MWQGQKHMRMQKGSVEDSEEEEQLWLNHEWIEFSGETQQGCFAVLNASSRSDIRNLKWNQVSLVV